MGRPRRHLDISLIITGELLAIFGQLYIHAPQGYLGAANQLTSIGLALASLGIVGGLGAALAIVRGRAWGQALAATLQLCFMAIFIPALAHDPIHTGLVIACHLYVFSRLVPQKTKVPRALRSTKPDESTYLAHRNSALMAILMTVAIIGFRLTDHAFGLGLCAIAHGVAAAYFVPTWRLQKESNPRLFYILAGFFLVCLLLIPLPRQGISIAAIFQLLALYGSIRERPILPGFLNYFLRLPALFVTVSFIMLILLGTLLLSFPASLNAGSLSPLDALFTAVSAVCVTGLNVVETASTFTRFGQGVILALIQLGGLGIMALSTMGARIIVGNLGLLAESTFGSLLDVRGSRSVHKLMRVILISTVSLESIGAVILSYRFRAMGLDWSEAIWKGVFHAVAAFCNAGFALQSDSLQSMARDHAALFAIMGLVFIGSIGFPTMVMLADHWSNPQRARIPIQARIILWTTLILIVSGWLGFLALEWHGALSDFEPGGKIVNALFQSINLRSAGFSSIPLAKLSAATLAFMIMFMFIGGAPGSTAGGVKVTTVALLLAAVPSFGQGEGTVTLGGRRIPSSSMYRAISVVVVTLTTVLTLHFFLLMVQNQSFEAIAFEAVSAVGTVGLSVGVTPRLGTVGKLLVMMGMFAGRIGPLTLTLAIAGRQQKRHTLASEPVMVG